jgi:HPt (histidine-containing phosphotransfer) domain-containing protein
MRRCDIGSHRLNANTSQPTEFEATHDAFIPLVNALFWSHCTLQRRGRFAMTAAALGGANPPDPVVLDPGALAVLRDLDPPGGGPSGVLQRVLAAFDKSLTRLMGELQVQIEGSVQIHNADAVFAIAHQLKAPAASCGAMALAQGSRDMEQKYRPSPERSADVLADLRADVTRLLGLAQAAQVAVRAML